MSHAGKLLEREMNDLLRMATESAAFYEDLAQALERHDVLKPLTKSPATEAYGNAIGLRPSIGLARRAPGRT